MVTLFFFIFISISENLQDNKYEKYIWLHHSFIFRILYIKEQSSTSNNS